MISEETLRALIVDDEVPAREHLTQLLECHCNVKIIGEANSVATAAALSRDLQPKPHESSQQILTRHRIGPEPVLRQRHDSFRLSNAIRYTHHAPPCA
jgi:hypothetical protein